MEDGVVAYDQEQIEVLREQRQKINISDKAIDR